MSDREELEALRRLAELEDKASRSNPKASASVQVMNDPITRAAMNPTEGMSTTQKTLAGAGKFFADTGRGLAQMTPWGPSRKEIGEIRDRDVPLMASPAGFVGNLAGGVATAVPLAFIPGANTLAGSVISGAGLAAAQPVAEDESRTKNAIIGATVGGAAKVGMDKLGTFLADRAAKAAAEQQIRQAANAPRDATLQAAKDAGYTIPPSMQDSGIVPRILEGISGKFKTNQLATVRNQEVTDNLARQALGLPKGTPLTTDTLAQVRSQAAASGYAPVANAGAVQTDQQFQNALNAIVSNRQGAARSFPAAVKNDIQEVVDALRVKNFDAGDALKMSQILRDEASAAFAAGDKQLGTAKREASKAIEDQIERTLAAGGKDAAGMLKSFRDARQLIAKTFTVEKAIREGSGSVNAKTIAGEFQRGKPLTDELKTIGGFGNNFGEVAGLPKSGNANPFTALDWVVGGGGSIASPAMAAIPLARVASRYGILSGPAQQMMGPSYATPLSTRIASNVANNPLVRGTVPLAAIPAALGIAE